MKCTKHRTQRGWWRIMHRWWPFRERDSWSQTQSLCLVSRHTWVMKVPNFTYTLQAQMWWGQLCVMKSAMKHTSHTHTKNVKWVTRGVRFLLNLISIVFWDHFTVHENTETFRSQNFHQSLGHFFLTKLQTIARFWSLESTKKTPL